MRVFKRGVRCGTSSPSYHMLRDIGISEVLVPVCNQILSEEISQYSSIFSWQEPVLVCLFFT